MKKILAAFLVVALLSSFNSPNLKGLWQYCGETFNGKRNAASADYTLQRKYDKKHFEAIVLEKGEKPYTYESGDYSLNADTCLETQTFCAQKSATLGKTITYTYTIINDTLTFKGILPNGNTVESYWKKVK
ncbi:hypothetical protein GCM10023149_02590 [Mucilaginibacter gynuensis]|uniref:Lipocalin-like protein n=1 Tax=Mucilaginibacter gynuensis TaxID=1302236 RepID=A0ABP8FPZ4_9SPHI